MAAPEHDLARRVRDARGLQRVEATRSATAIIIGMSCSITTTVIPDTSRRSRSTCASASTSRWARPADGSSSSTTFGSNANRQASRAPLPFEELGLTATWLEGKEPAPATAPPRAHQYLGGDDTFTFDPSFDGYGGGGLVSTAAELAAFVRALVTGDVLSEPSRAAMLDACVPTDLGELGQRCGYGVFESTIDGITRIGHEGFWGVWMYHLPDHDVTVAGAHTGLPYDATAKRTLLHGPVQLLGG